jgi:hypothetical protein
MVVNPNCLNILKICCKIKPYEASGLSHIVSHLKPTKKELTQFSQFDDGSWKKKYLLALEVETYECILLSGIDIRFRSAISQCFGN